MEFKKTSVVSTPEILKRKLGGELFVPVTIDEDAFTDGVVKAGTPINADGEIAETTTTESGSTNDAVGILLNDVYAENPNGSLIKAFATINSDVAEEWADVEYDDALKSALPNIVFE